MENLNSNEELVMRILWNLKKALVRDVLDNLPKPKPPYTTVSSIIRLLEKKGYVGHKAYGNTFEYYPLIQRDEYTKKSINRMVKDFFGGSVENLLSFMVEEKQIADKEMNELKQLIEKYENGEKS